MDYIAIAKSVVKPSNVVGSVVKTFGTKGELIIKVWDTFPCDITEPLWVEIDSLAVPVFMKSFKNQGTLKAVVVFEDFENEELTQMLIGKTLYSLEAQSDNEDFSHLTNYTLKDLTSQREFKIEGYIDSELNPLLELEGDFLVPITDELIHKIDDKKKIIEVNLPEGIFEL